MENGHGHMGLAGMSDMAQEVMDEIPEDIEGETDRHDSEEVPEHQVDQIVPCHLCLGDIQGFRDNDIDLGAKKLPTSQ